MTKTASTSNAASEPATATMAKTARAVAMANPASWSSSTDPTAVALAGSAT